MLYNYKIIWVKKWLDKIRKTKYHKNEKNNLYTHIYRSTHSHKDDVHFTMIQFKNFWYYENDTYPVEIVSQILNSDLFPGYLYKEQYWALVVNSSSTT